MSNLMQDPSHNHALLAAARACDSVKFYNALKAGANIDFQDSEGTTALMILALGYGEYDTKRSGNHRVMLQTLLHSKADTALLDNQGRDAIDIAWEKGESGIVTKLYKLAIEQRGPFWKKDGDQLVTRASMVKKIGIVTEHFDFATKMYTSVIHSHGWTSNNHSRVAFNCVSRDLVAEARGFLKTPPLAPRAPYKPVVL
jgi:hypothetical protein